MPTREEETARERGPGFRPTDPQGSGPRPTDLGGPDARGREACANCGAELQGDFCHRCGQAAESPVGPIREVGAHLLRGFTDLDRRIVRTSKALLFEPGRLSEEWIEGRRERWVGPIRLYVACSVAYFVVAALAGTHSILFIQLQSGEGAEHFVEWLPRLMFLVVPAFALLLAGLFRRDGRYYVEHLVFALHVHSAWYLLLTVDAAIRPLLVAAPEAWTWERIVLTAVSIGIQLAVWIYLWTALRRFYGRGPLSTLGRTLLMMLGYGFLLTGATLTIIALVRS